MMSFNKVVLIGKLTRDPELKYSASGTGIAVLGLAVNHQYKEKKETCFVDVTCFGKLSEVVAQYCSKGKPVLVEGRLDQQRWDDANTGQKRSKHQIIAQSVVFLGSGGPTQSPNPAEGAEAYDERF